MKFETELSYTFFNKLAIPRKNQREIKLDAIVMVICQMIVMNFLNIKRFKDNLLQNIDLHNFELIMYFPQGIPSTNPENFIFGKLFELQLFFALFEIMLIFPADDIPLKMTLH